MFGPVKSILESETDRHIEGLIKEILAEIFNKDFREKLKAAILAEGIEDKTMFAAKAAVNEFVDRVKAPICGDLVKIRLFNSADEDEDDE